MAIMNMSLASLTNLFILENLDSDKTGVKDKSFSTNSMVSWNEMKTEQLWKIKLNTSIIVIEINHKTVVIISLM